MLHHGENWGLSLPLDIMVGTVNARRSSKAVRSRVYSKPLPYGAFINAGNGLYVSSPEFCFLQMAGDYSLAKLIMLGLELCGSYSLPCKDSAGADQNASEQAVFDIKPLTNKKKIEAFAARIGGWTGHSNSQALRALRYIADDSASPMETILVILLTLPYKRGGYGLPTPELNGRIDPKKGAERFIGRGFYRGDLLWRKYGVVAEYNSDAEHASPERIANDAIRRNDLNLCGIHEVTVTKKQLYDAELFDNVARQIAAKIGRELRYKKTGFPEARKELRSTIF